MKTITRILLTAILASGATAQGQESSAYSKAAAAPLAEGFTGVQGADPDWYFLQKELAHLATGPYWEGDYSNTASKTDPAPIIVDYHEKLKAAGVELLLIPVPPKASVYPDKFSTEAQPTALAPFYAKLAEAGVQVIDLEPIFEAELEKDPAKTLYCEKDSHYSPYATQLVADLIHQRYADSDWVKAIEPDIEFVTGEEKTITIDGDLLPAGKEDLTVVEVNNSDGEQVQPDDTDSPIILLGDSHTAVFSVGGELHCKAAGLPDHLQAKFGTKLEHIANFGSGTHNARVQLLRKGHQVPGFWDNKKLVIWHFSAREFTQAPKWANIPPKA
ncbi:MAG: alginate O-acetyltransferase AlgX-related protein [Verrucomicrobiales bacterium]